MVEDDEGDDDVDVVLFVWGEIVVLEFDVVCVVDSVFFGNGFNSDVSMVLGVEIYVVVNYRWEEGVVGVVVVGEFVNYNGFEVVGDGVEVVDLVVLFEYVVDGYDEVSEDYEG